MTSRLSSAYYIPVVSFHRKDDIMSRYEPYYPTFEWDDCGCGKKKKHMMCMPDAPCRPQPHVCRDEPAFRVQLFDNCNKCCDDRRLPPAAPPVTIVNPWNCREKAVVILSVDECGNLVVQVKR